MTELERAREHLKLCQRNLAQQRKHGLRDLDYLDEDRVLAALTWVWYAQCREVFDESDRMSRFFETAACRDFINKVDWSATRGALVYLKEAS